MTFVTLFLSFFLVIFETMRSLDKLVDHGCNVKIEEYRHSLRVYRLRIAYLDKNLQVNKEYYHEVVKYIMSIDTLTRLKVVHETMYHMVKEAMTQNLRLPFRQFNHHYIYISLVLGREENLNFSTHNVDWNDVFLTERFA